MKSYVFSLVAIMMAIGMVAFTSKDNAAPKKVSALSTAFYYFPPVPGDYSLPSVQNKNNWLSTGGNPTACDGDQNKACLMEVDDDYTEVINGQREFKTSGNVVNITAIPGDAGATTGHVPSLTSGILDRTDRP